MEKKKNANNISNYVKRHWFQFIILGFLLFVLMRKDLSFQINMNNPDNVEKPSFQPVDIKRKNKEILTQKTEVKKAEKSNPGILDRFGLAFIGGEKRSNPKSEFSTIDDKTITSYLKRFAHVAISERKKYGVPSSIILANSLFHSFGGTRELTRSGNNHFAIGCAENWTGNYGTYQNKCYRHYENSWTSFRDHSLFVTSGKFSELLHFSSTDYKSWAKGLEKLGFSEFEDLGKSLIQIIEKYELYHLDFQ